MTDQSNSAVPEAAIAAAAEVMCASDMGQARDGQPPCGPHLVETGNTCGCEDSPQSTPVGLDLEEIRAHANCAHAWEIRNDGGDLYLVGEAGRIGPVSGSDAELWAHARPWILALAAKAERLTRDHDALKRQISIERDGWRLIGRDIKSALGMDPDDSGGVEAVAAHVRQERDQARAKLYQLQKERFRARTEVADAYERGAESMREQAASVAEEAHALDIAATIRALPTPAPTVWSTAVPPGGEVCAVPVIDAPGGICGMPSELCPDHGSDQ